jgi:hypothetical protein
MSRQTPLGRLNDLVDSDFVPQPIRWTLVSSDDEDAEQLPMDEDEVEESTNDELEVVESANGDDTNGKRGANGELGDDDDDDDDEASDQILMRLTLGKRGEDEFYEYELWHDVGEQLKKTKHRLALTALDDLMGTDCYNEGEGGSDDDDEGTYPGITSSGYAWEVSS